jgi:hypothetical protein
MVVPKASGISSCKETTMAASLVVALRAMEKKVHKSLKACQLVSFLIMLMESMISLSLRIQETKRKCSNFSGLETHGAVLNG